MGVAEVWDKIFRTQGQFIAGWPVLTVAVAYIVSLQCGLGWTRLGTLQGVGSRRFINADWALVDLTYYEALKEFDHLNQFDTASDWGVSQGAIAMYLPKEEYKAVDLISKESFQEMYDVWSQWWDITVVTTLGNEYTTYDLCARRPLPDGIGFPVYPCTQLSVFDCFNETRSYLHPSYEFIDRITPAPTPTTVPYHTKPSWMASTSPSVLKAAVSACTSFDPVLRWSPTSLIPQAVIENGMVKAGNMFYHLQLYEGAKRGAWRTQYAKGGPMTKTERDLDFREARDMHNRIFEALFYDREKTSTKFKYAMLRDLDVQYTVDMKLRVAPEVNLYLIGLVLVSCVQLTLVSCRYSQDSRLQLSFFGSFLAILSTACGMGLYLRCGFSLSEYTVGLLPFLSLGVGFDDVFVIMFGITEIDRAFFDTNTTDVVVGELFARVGRGVTLSTLCTVIAFSLGSQVPLPTIADFCVGVVICAGLNWFHMLSTFGVAVSCEVSRIKQNIPEVICCPCQLGICCCCCPSCSSCSAQATETKGDWAYGAQERFLDFLYGVWAPLLAKLPVAALVFSIGLAGAGTAMWPVFTMEAGSRQGDASPSSLSDAVESLFVYSNSAGFTVVLNDIDVPSLQLDILDTMNDVLATDRATPGNNYVQVFRGIVAQMQDQARAQYQASNGMAFDVMNTNHSLIRNNDINDPVGMDDPITAIDPVTGNTNVLVATKRDLWYQVWHGFADFPADSTDAITKLFNNDVGYIFADSLNTNEFIYHDSADPKLARLKMSALYANSKMEDYDGLTSGILSVEKVFEDARRTKFGRSGIFVSQPWWNITSALGVLEATFWRLFVIDLFVIMFVSAFLLGSVIASVVTSFVCAFVVFEVLGMTLLLVKFNPILVVIGLAAMGIAVEDIAHNVCAFIVEPGTIQHRLGTAMRVTFVPTYQGSLSTFVGLIPMAWSRNTWAVESSLYPFTMIIVFGFTNGMIIAPSFCSLLSNLLSVTSKGTGEVAKI